MYVYVVVYYWCLLNFIDAYESVGTNNIHILTLTMNRLHPAHWQARQGGKGVASAAARPSTPTALELGHHPTWLLGLVWPTLVMVTYHNIMTNYQHIKCINLGILQHERTNWQMLNNILKDLHRSEHEITFETKNYVTTGFLWAWYFSVKIFWLSPRSDKCKTVPYLPQKHSFQQLSAPLSPRNSNARRACAGCLPSRAA